MSDRARHLSRSIRDDASPPNPPSVPGPGCEAGRVGERGVTLAAIWSGTAIVKDRAGREEGRPVRCPSPCASLAGGLSPEGPADLKWIRGLFNAGGQTIRRIG